MLHLVNTDKISSKDTKPLSLCALLVILINFELVLGCGKTVSCLRNMFHRHFTREQKHVNSKAPERLCEGNCCSQRYFRTAKQVKVSSQTYEFHDLACSLPQIVRMMEKYSF